MKIALHALILTLLASCDEHRHEAEETPPVEPRPAITIMTFRGERMTFDAYKKLVDQEQREHDRIRSLTAFEQAIEGEGFEMLATAFIVRKSEDGSVATTQELYRRAPSDPEEYVPASMGTGNYLVGSLMPIWGYGIHDSRRENRFCIGVTDNGAFAHGAGVSQLTSIKDIEARINQTSEQDGGGNRGGG